MPRGAFDRSHLRRPLSERFWEKVEKTDGCWLWIGGSQTYKGKQWHGIVRLTTTKQEQAHRVAWRLMVGPIPAGLWVLHHCDNPLCVRPDHLYLGTPADNARDRDTRGRASRGSAHPDAKLTEEIVREIRRRWKNPDTTAALAREFGVTPAAGRFAATGRTWSHVS